MTKPSYPVEWEDSDSEISSNSDSVRCLISWLGGSVQQGEHKRLMDPTGTDNAHQLVGAPSGGSGSEYLSQEPSWSFGVTATGQFHSGSLHK